MAATRATSNIASPIIGRKPATNTGPVCSPSKLIVFTTAKRPRGLDRRLPKRVNRVTLAPLALHHVLEHAQPHQVFGIGRGRPIHHKGPVADLPLIRCGAHNDRYNARPSSHPEANHPWCPEKQLRNSLPPHCPHQCRSSDSSPCGQPLPKSHRAARQSQWRILHSRAVEGTGYNSGIIVKRRTDDLGVTPVNAARVTIAQFCYRLLCDRLLQALGFDPSKHSPSSVCLSLHVLPSEALPASHGKCAPWGPKVWGANAGRAAAGWGEGNWVIQSST